MEEHSNRTCCVARLCEDVQIFRNVPGPLSLQPVVHWADAFKAMRNALAIGKSATAHKATAQRYKTAGG